jgi:hypothetical protein
MSHLRILTLSRPSVHLPWALLLASMVSATFVFGQGKLVDQRDQAEGWYVPVHGHVMSEGKKVDGVEVMLYKDNVALGKVPVSKKGTFELQLDIDQMFTVMISKPGFQNKMIYVDTSLPKDLVEYPDYECFVTLAPPNAQNIETFYTDFPSAIIRWNPEMGGFYHSEQYLTHIQTRLSGIASATF